MDKVHVDEKWYDITQRNAHIYLAFGEQPPQQSVKSKNNIDKLMIFSAVASPWYDHLTYSWFDSKIGTWVFAEEVPAQRNSCNCPAGKCSMSQKNMYCLFLIKIVVPP